ncbi:MAG: hydrogenase maturation nickel metallochaperone HypA [Myxococcales bacterium]|nr:hydrogenase maturation nickel metallochaperone HypA [Myxococcales bacterium]
MHEYSIVGALIAEVEAEARRRGASRVHRVQVRLGERSGVEIELLREAYALFREGSICATAPLEIEPIPARWGCPECGLLLREGAPLRCAPCARPATMLQGDEILLQRLHLEVA